MHYNPVQLDEERENILKVNFKVRERQGTLWKCERRAQPPRSLSSLALQCNAAREEIDTPWRQTAGEEEEEREGKSCWQRLSPATGKQKFGEIAMNDKGGRRTGRRRVPYGVVRCCNS
jgi:hypothetical protein